MRRDDTRRARSTRGLVLVSLLAATSLGCDETPAELGGDFLPDGTYTIRLTDPIILDPWRTPGFMLAEPVIRFTKQGSALTILPNPDGNVWPGEPNIVQRLEDEWNVHFAYHDSPGAYWAVRVRADRCDGKAVRIRSDEILNAYVTCSIAVSSPTGLTTSIEVVAGDGQSAFAGTAVATPPLVVVKDELGNPVAGQPVLFSVSEGGGLVVPDRAFATNTDGLATVLTWTLGPEPGPNTLTATALGFEGVRAVLTATSLGPQVRFISNDEASFLAETGASLEVSFPTARSLTTTPYVEGRVSLRDEGGLNNRVGDETPLLAGNEFVVSGYEDNVVFTFSQRATAFGFWMVDGAGWDSEFELEFFSEGSSIARYSVDPLAGQPFFMGFASQTGLDRVVLRETQPGSDENDPIGRIFVRF